MTTSRPPLRAYARARCSHASFVIPYGEMEDPVDAGEEAVERRLCQVRADDVERGRVLLLQPRIVRVGERVDRDEIVPGRDDGVGQL